jgi:hypothetical protein
MRWIALLELVSRVGLLRARPAERSIWSVTSARPRGRDERGRCPRGPREANGGRAVVGVAVVDRAGQEGAPLTENANVPMRDQAAAPRRPADRRRSRVAPRRRAAHLRRRLPRHEPQHVAVLLQARPATAAPCTQASRRSAWRGEGRRERCVLSPQARGW